MRWSKSRFLSYRKFNLKKIAKPHVCKLVDLSILRQSNRSFIQGSPTSPVNRVFSNKTATGLRLESTIETDFFEEPVTFILNKKHEVITDSINETLIAYDNFVVQYVTRGKAINDGGDEFGISAKAAHSTAILWSELILNMSKWCKIEGNVLRCEVPMLACASISPLIAIGGLSYLRHLDESYLKSMPHSLTRMAEAAVSYLSDDGIYLSDRERYHLQALNFLLRNEHRSALKSIRKLLEICPGDALGLSLAIDLSSSLSDKMSAFQSATSVASYWSERGQRSVTGQTSIPGFAIGSSFIALGLAVGGRYREAEQLVDIALSRDNDSSGVCAWALANIYDSEGRVGEGTSLFTGFGVDYYEQCGFLFTDAMLAGLGGRFVLDRDGATSENVALRLYDEYFGRVLEYSGYIDEVKEPVIMFAPKSHQSMVINTAAGAASSVISQLFGDTKPSENSKLPAHKDQESKTKTHNLVDIFSWLPPHSSLLVNGTFLLFRLTISGAVSATDERWAFLKVAWKKVIQIENKYCEGDVLFANFPLSRVAALLVLGDEYFHQDLQYHDNNLEVTIVSLGALVCVNQNAFQIDEMSWVKVTQALSEFRKNESKETLFGWDLNFSNFIEHSICYAAIQSDNHEALCTARSICSESLALKRNSPETWFRYGLVLEKLGDEENAQNAFKASISLGSGEGGRINPT